MESDKLSVKITYLITAIDGRMGVSNPSHLKILLTDDLDFPSITLDNLNGGLESYLQQIHNTYLKYDFNYPYKSLVGARSIDGVCELVYITVSSYMPSFNLSGRLFSLQEILDRNIEIEDYYGQLITRFASIPF